MRKFMGGAATLACAAALAMPGVAAAQEPECDTLVTCAVQTAQKAADDAIALVLQKVGEARDLAFATLADAQVRATAGVHECVVQARVRPDGTGIGDANCVSRYANGPNPAVVSGELVIQGARIVQGVGGPRVTFEGTTNPITFDASNGTPYTITRLDDRAAVGGLSVHSGTWSGNGPAYTAAAAFHTVPAGPFAPAGDHFFNGVIVLEGAV